MNTFLKSILVAAIIMISITLFGGVVMGFALSHNPYTPFSEGFMKHINLTIQYWYYFIGLYAVAALLLFLVFKFKRD
jgi:hypothetical protein